LTVGELLEGYSHVGKMLLDGLSHRGGDIGLYLLYLLRVEGKDGRALSMRPSQAQSG
jgi:hypothetical protein